MSEAYDPLNWYWIVAGDESRWWSSAAIAYVPPVEAWGEAGNVPTAIADEVELNSVLLCQAPRLAMTRAFTAAEVMVALDRIDPKQTAATFTIEEITAPTAAMAERLQALAAILGVGLGMIGS